MTKISITRALAEIKYLGDRIQKAIEGGTFIAATYGKDKNRVVMGTGESVTTIEKLIESSKKSVEDLIARRSKLKSEVIKSNAKTQVTIGGQDMTVAEAIERKAGIAFEKAYYQALVKQYGAASQRIERQRTELDGKIHAQLNNLSGGDKNKLNEESTKGVTDSLRSQFEPSLLDPLNLQQVIASLEKDISNFENEVDFVLSESNAKTEIEV